MKFMETAQIKIWKILPANFPTCWTEAFDDAKKAFWKAAAPAELAKEKMLTVYLERVIAEQDDRIEELTAIEPGTRESILQETVELFRKRIDQMQIQMGDLEEENAALKARISELTAKSPAK